MTHSGAVKIVSISFTPFTRQQALDSMINLAREQKRAWIVTSNLDHVVLADANQRFRENIHKSDCIVADGWPVVLALRLMGHPGAQRIAGSDFLPLIAEQCAKNGMSIFLMGGMPGWADEAASVLVNRFPGLKIAGTYCPPFGFENSPDETRKMIDLTKSTKPDFLFLGVGSPKQENWIADHRAELGCGAVIGVGATIGFVSGRINRAPWFFKKFGLEWFYRFCQEPARLGPRYAKDLLMIPRIAAIVIRHKLKS
jgi:N-acetylglucosaminyldiphosphoundecaprenol N-acetyl-beta-D-mannosaminyltransferase